MEKEFYTLPEVSEMVGVKRCTLRKQCRLGKHPYFKNVMNRWYIMKEDFNKEYPDIEIKEEK